MKLMHITFIMIGLVTLGVGIIGAFLPVLPTAPFFLITAFCFSKGSPRFHSWFCSTKIYEKHLNTFVTERKMTLKTKLCILLPASGVMTVAFVFSPWWHMKVFLVFLCICKYVYFFTRIATEEK